MQNQNFTYQKALFFAGGVYSGEVKNGKANGRGTFEKDNTKFIGTWVNNEIQTQNVTIVYNTGDIYEGQINAEEGKPEGKGICYYKHNNMPIEINKYEGEFKNGKANGYGSLTLNDNTKHSGLWEDNKLYGQVTIIIPNVGVYMGEVNEDRAPDKSGILYLTNGDVYQGEFKNAKIHGYGTLKIKETNQIIQGNWQNDEFIGNSTKEEVLDASLQASRVNIINFANESATSKLNNFVSIDATERRNKVNLQEIAKFTLNLN